MPLIGGGVALLGAPTAVAEPVTLDLIEAYRRWLVLEHYLLLEECSAPPLRFFAERFAESITPGSMAESYAQYLVRKRRVAKVEEEFRSECCNFRFRAGFVTERPMPAVDRFFMDVNRDQAIVSPPASTRAALVMSAVGCEWRAPC